MPARADSLFTNPTAASFLAVELRGRIADVEADTDAGPLAQPRLNLMRQAAHELEQTAAPDPS